MSYGPHPSAKLRALFEARPFQGAEPSSARFLFFGLDANFALDIEATDSFPDVCDYLQDGVRFWRDRKKHHPFLLTTYQGSGRGYHKQFEKIGFTPEHASQVSFVEVLDVPTHGSGRPPISLLHAEHLTRLEEWVNCGAAQYVFMPQSVIALLHKVKRFVWLNSNAVSQRGSLPILHETIRTTIFSPYHFSYRYASRAIREQQLSDIGRLIDG